MATNEMEVTGIRPYSVEAEMSVLGGMLVDVEVVPKVVAALDPGGADFHREANRRLYRAMVRTWEETRSLEPVVLSEALRADGDFDAAGGAAYLAQLWDYVPTAANISYHLDILREKARRRRLIEAGQRIQELGRSEAVLSAALDEAERLVFASAEGEGTGGPELVKGYIMPAIERATSGERGLELGFEDVDRMTMGFEPGELVIVAGATSMGKSAFAWQAGTYVASQQKQVLGFSLEMTKPELTWRMLCAEGMVDGLRVRRQGIDGYPEAAAQLHQAASRLNGIPIWIDDSPSLSSLDIRARARRHAAEHGLDLVIVDHIQIMADPEKDRNRGLARITSELKALAKELSCPVIALSQLSRFKERADKRPQLSDLRESGAIEENADAVLFVYRPEYYHGATDKEGNSLEGKAEILIAKRRNGATGPVDLFYRKESTRFESISHRSRA